MFNRVVVDVRVVSGTNEPQEVVIATPDLLSFFDGVLCGAVFYPGLLASSDETQD
jgi:hypothetical protein